MKAASRIESEAALRLLRSTYVDFQDSPHNLLRVGRIRRPFAHDAGKTLLEARRQGCYLRLISIVEAYVDTMNASLLAAAVDPPSVTVQKLIEQLDARSRGWGDRGGIFKAVHGVRLADCPAWPAFETGTRVRNSIAHGLGSMTSRQQRDVQFAAQLASVEVGVAEGRLLITDRSVKVAFDFCWQMVVGLDTLLPLEPP